MGWKKVLGGGIAVVAVGVGGLVAYGATRPKTWHVERSAVVAAQPADVLPLLADLEQWPKWAGGPDAATSGMTYTFGASRSGAGATYSWSGPGTHGTVTLVAVEPAGVRYEMRMEDAGTPARGSIALAAEGERTRVTWTDEGDFSAMGPVGGLLVPMMEKSLGPHFEGALAVLGDLAEDAAEARNQAEARRSAEAAMAPEATTASGDPVDATAP